MEPWSEHPQRSPRIVENRYPPSYDQSQHNLAAPENVEHVERNGEDDTEKIGSMPSPTFSHQTPASVADSRPETRSPTFSDVTMPRSSQPLSPTFSWTDTEVGTPEPEQPGLEPVGLHQAPEVKRNKSDENVGKEVYAPALPDPAQYAPQAVLGDEEKQKSKRVCGLRRRNFVILLVVAIVIALAIALGVGLGVGLNRKKSSPSVNAENIYGMGGTLNPAYYSSQGAFNGSGLALASQSFANDEQGTIVMYYQHFSGTIRFKQLRGSDWIGGTDSEIVASDAKNGTPLAAVAYALNQTSTWHIFYIDTDNHLRQKSNSNSTNIWQDGPLNALQLTPLDSPAVGMQACWYGSFYGDTDYKGLRPSVQQNSPNSTNYPTEVGMHLWYASNETTFQQYGWRDGQDTWERQEEWTGKNGHAGVACYSWGSGTVTYAMMVNTENTAEIWWKDTNSSMKSTEKHPINKWTNASVAIPNVHSSTSMGYTTFLYAQDTEGFFHGYNLSTAAEDTSIVSQDTFTVQLNGDNQGKGLLGSHLSVSALNDNSGGESLIVFYQTEGDDITEFTRDLYGGPWSFAQLPVNDD